MPGTPAPPGGYIGVTRRPSRREWRGALILFAVGTVGLVLALLFLRPNPNLLAVGATAPRVSLDAAGGDRVDVPDAAGGRPYILEFFEAGCAHCQQVAARLCDEPIPVFAVDAAKDSAQTVLSYRARYAPRCSYPLLIDPNLTAGAAYAVNVVPTVYVVKAGRIAYAGAGLDGVDGLPAAVRRAVGG